MNIQTFFFLKKKSRFRFRCYGLYLINELIFNDEVIDALLVNEAEPLENTLPATHCFACHEQNVVVTIELQQSNAETSFLVNET